MAKVYKRKNPNTKKVVGLFILQVLLGVLPVCLFLVFVYNFTSSDYSVALIFIAIMLLGLALYLTVGRRYNVLLSGLRGERSLRRIAKSIGGDWIAFANLPIRYGKNRSELDLLLIGTAGVVTVEVKNHSGVIVGSDSDKTWLQKKYYRHGKTAESRMENPFMQIKRQREILKSILRAAGFDVWVDNVLFFSSDGARLRLNIEGASNYVAAGAEDLKAFLKDYRSKKPLSKRERDEISAVLRATESE